MTILILILALAWCAYLLPAALRRRQSRPSALGDYRRSLTRLSGIGSDEFRGARMSPSRSVAAARARRARKRRRDVFLGLSATAIGSFAIGLLPAFRVMLLVALAVSAALGVYAVALVRMRTPAPARVRSGAYAYARAGRPGEDREDGWSDERWAEPWEAVEVVREPGLRRRSDWVDRSDWADRSDRSDWADRSDRSDWADRSDLVDVD